MRISAKARCGGLGKILTPYGWILVTLQQYHMTPDARPPGGPKDFTVSTLGGRKLSRRIVFSSFDHLYSTDHIPT